jgi:peptide deformylase
MAVLRILQYPESVLKQKAAPVTEFDDDLQKLIDDMFDTLYSAPGIGLAASQIGKPLRLFVYDLKEADEAPRHKGVMINPEFVEMTGSQNGEEGCLSVEEYRTRVPRKNRVVITGLERDGKKVTLEGQGLLARLFQHEMDHLDGKLFIDEISSLKRNLFLKRFKKRQRVERAD